MRSYRVRCRSSTSTHNRKEWPSTCQSRQSRQTHAELYVTHKVTMTPYEPYHLQRRRHGIERSTIEQKTTLTLQTAPSSRPATCAKILQPKNTFSCRFTSATCQCGEHGRASHCSTTARAGRARRFQGAGWRQRKRRCECKRAARRLRPATPKTSPGLQTKQRG